MRQDCALPLLTSAGFPLPLPTLLVLLRLYLQIISRASTGRATSYPDTRLPKSSTLGVPDSPT